MPSSASPTAPVQAQIEHDQVIVQEIRHRSHPSIFYFNQSELLQYAAIKI
jgi:hypothetical protein